MRLTTHNKAAITKEVHTRGERKRTGRRFIAGSPRRIHVPLPKESGLAEIILMAHAAEY
jgi:hypothetical protein